MPKTSVLIIGIGLMFLFVGGVWWSASVAGIQKSASLVEPPSLPPPTPTFVPTATPEPGQLHTRYLTGTYPSSWWFGTDTIFYHSLFQGDSGSAIWGCSGDAEWDEIAKVQVINVYFIICPTHLRDPEAVLETAAPNVNMSATNFTGRKYIPHSAVPSIRFGMQGLKGTWMQGVQDTYVPEYFEVYVRNNQLLIINPVQGDNKAFEDLLANIKPNF